MAAKFLILLVSLATALLPAGAGIADDRAPEFEHVMNIGSEGLGPGQFKYIEDFAFDSEGRLLVTDAAHAWVQAFDPATGAYITRFGGKGYADHHLDKPEGIAVDDEGNIFVADYNTGFVKKYDRSYAWRMTFSEYGSELGQNMKSEFMDIRDGRLYLPDVGNNRVNVFDLSGEPLFHFGGEGTAPGQLDSPEAAKFNSEGKLFVTDLMNDRIQIFDADGKPLAVIGGSGTGPGEFSAPAGIAFDRHDRIYVTEIGNNRVQVLDSTGRFLTMWGRQGSGDGEFGNLHGIIVDRDTGRVYVADTANNRIQVFRPVGGSKNPT